MKISEFQAYVKCPTEWISGRYDAFAGASDLFINGTIVPDGEFDLRDGDVVRVSTPCNELRGVARNVVRDGRHWRFTFDDASYEGAFYGVGGDFDGFNWTPALEAKTPIETSLPGIKTWGGYTRFREELAKSAKHLNGRRWDNDGIGGNGVPFSAAARCALDFQANRPLSLSERDFEIS